MGIPLLVSLQSSTPLKSSSEKNMKVLQSFPLLFTLAATTTSLPTPPRAMLSSDLTPTTPSESLTSSSGLERDLLEILQPSPEPSFPSLPPSQAHTVIFNLASPPSDIENSIASVLALPDIEPGLAHYLQSYNVEKVQHHRKVVDAMEAVELPPVALLSHLSLGPDLDDEEPVQILAKISLAASE